MGQRNTLLSIGIIFKNDIRCIERCLKALEPLRKAVPSELVMADTGSEDGSRQVAEQYADILIDFPWINDFAAARNAVMDRCSGKWYLGVDTDEYLDEDISQIVKFLRDKKRLEAGGVVCIRNYDNYELTGNYTDFLALRMIRMSLGLRYTGAIHERFDVEGTLNLYALNKTIFHHDGYVELGGEQGKAKRERNISLLREKLKDDPDDLMALLQFIESGGNESDFMDQLRHALSLVEEKRDGWDKVGPPIFRYAVIVAEQKKLPRFSEWLGKAEELFSDSPYFRIDVAHAAFGHYWNGGQYADSIQYGEMYLKAMADYNAGRTDPLAQMFSVIKMTAPHWERNLKAFLAEAYRAEGRIQDAVNLINGLDMQLLDVTQTEMLVRVLKRIHARSEIDTTPIITALWDGITSPQSTEEEVEQRKRAFIREAGSAFTSKYRGSEENEAEIRRHAYTLFLPLADRCEPGLAAAILEAEDASVLEELLAKVEDWKQFSIHALAHALEKGARFPTPGMTMNIEDMDRLAARLSGEKNDLFRLVQLAADRESSEEVRELAWNRGLAIAAIRAFEWQAEKPEVEQGLSVGRAFAKAERKFLPLCYAPDALSDENSFLLPPVHRFGWYCAQAFETLDAGDAAGCVHLLRAGLAACEEMKSMVKFLLGNMMELQVKPEPSAELQTLADQIRAVLANFAPDDPAVTALKQSEAYQKVAHLIEGVEVPVVGGLAQ